MKAKGFVLFATILFAALLWNTKAEASYQSRNVIISAPENGSVQEYGKNVKVEYTVYDVYMNVLNNELITHAEISYYKDGQLLDVGNLGYIWKRGDWFKGGIEFYTYGAGEYTVDITCIPMNSTTYEVDDRISTSMYPAKTIKFYIYEDKGATASFEQTNVSLKVGDAPYTNSFRTNSDGDVEFFSGNPKVAKVNASTGAVTAVSAGKATITAKVNRSCNYKEVKASYTVNVTGSGSGSSGNNSSKPKEKKVPTMKFEKSTMKKQVGDANFTNKLTTNSDGKVIYTSGNSLIAKVDKNTGEVTVVGAGMVTIVATSFETDSYKKATADFTLTVANATPTPTTTTGGSTAKEKKTPVLRFASATLNKKTGDPSFTNKLTAETDGQIIYTSGNTLVAKVDKNTGKITIVGAGMTTIVATSFETDNYKKGTATYTIKVTKAETASTASGSTTSGSGTTTGGTTTGGTTKPATGTTTGGSTGTTTGGSTGTTTGGTTTGGTTKPSTGGTTGGSTGTTTGIKTPTIKFASSSLTKKTTDGSFTNKLTCDSDGLITYTSSNTSVATINGSNGTITIKGSGATTITAKVSATSKYSAGSATFLLTVNKATSTGGGSVVTKKEAVLKFPTTTMTYVMNNMNRNPIYLTVSTKTTDGTVTYSSSNEKIVKIDPNNGKISMVGKGTVRIYARSSETSNYKAGEGYCDVTIK